MFRILRAALFLGLAASTAVVAAPPKATAPVALRAECLDAVRAGEPIRIRLSATPSTDAPLLRLRWILPPGVLVEGGGPAWSGAATAGKTVELLATIRLPDLGPRLLIGGATFERADGSRQVKAVTLELPSGSAAKATVLPPVTRNSQGQAIVEHLVPAR